MNDPAPLDDDLARWDSVADTYADVVGNGFDTMYLRFHEFLWRHLGDLAGRRVLDLGCGHGWLAGLLASSGATVIGVDGSAALLERARRAHPGIEFVHADLIQGLPSTSAAFDRIIAHMVFMDIPTIKPLIESVARSLTPDGTFVFTILHPSFFLQSPVEDLATGERYRKVTGYLEPATWWVESFGGHRHYHRTMSDYLNALSDAGLSVVEMIEPPTPALSSEGRSAGWADWFETIPTTVGLAAQLRR